MSRGKLVFVKLALAVILIIAIASTLFVIYEHTTPQEGVYRSIYILLTHHDNFHIESSVGRTVIILLVILSLLVVAYLIKLLGEYIINLGDGLKRNKVKAKLINAKDHYIVCGLGRVGINIAKELSNEGVKFIGIDQDESRVRDAINRGFLAFVGDSTKEETLVKAKVDKARGLVASLGDDSSNLFLTLTAKQLNPKVFVVARSNHSENVSRIAKAGADKVAMPNQIGGYHMATMLIRPGVVDFLEVVSNNSNAELQVEELVIPKHSRAVGERLSRLLSSATSQSTVLALNNTDGVSKVNPNGKEIIYPGDKLIVMGTRKQLDELSALV